MKIDGKLRGRATFDGRKINISASCDAPEIDGLPFGDSDVRLDSRLDADAEIALDERGRVVAIYFAHPQPLRAA